MNYSELQLHENIQRGLADAGYVTCTPVQEQVLQASLDGSDLYVQSQTGTGKTAAYLVTIMQELLSQPQAEDGTRRNALVMVPTRELAVQVEEEAEKLGRHTGLRAASFFGGVGYEKQVAALKEGVDIIIGTPGRVIDLRKGRQMDLSRVGFLAIDEADRMFDMGFYPDLRELIKHLPPSGERQTMLFSATLNLNVKNLAYEYTRSPKEITIEAENITVDEIDQELIHVSSDDKNRLLLSLIQKDRPESLIIFCNTKRMCEVLSKRLAINGIENEFLIGDLPQKRRQKIMDDFKAGNIRCLVATDVAARGIDVNDLAMVINYDLPNEAENYVHRIGRTARAGKSGKAYTLCSEQDVYSLMPIERYIEKQIPSRVAVEEDLAEDKSRDRWIRTGDWRDDGDEGGGNSRGGRRDGDRRRDGRRGEGRRRGERRDHEGRRDDAREDDGEGGRRGYGRREDEEGRRNGRRRARGDRPRRPGRSEEELAEMAGLPFDERMKRYKERYGAKSAAGQPSAERTEESRADGEKQDEARPDEAHRDGGRRRGRRRRSGGRDGSERNGAPRDENGGENDSRPTAEARPAEARSQDERPAEAQDSAQDADGGKKGLLSGIKSLFGRK